MFVGNMYKYNVAVITSSLTCLVLEYKVEAKLSAVKKRSMHTLLNGINVLLLIFLLYHTGIISYPYVRNKIPIIILTPRTIAG